MANSGTTNLGGSFTPAVLGAFTNNGATVNLTGTFDLGGGTFQLNGGTGSWNLLGGTMQNGTLDQTGGAMLILPRLHSPLHGRQACQCFAGWLPSIVSWAPSSREWPFAQEIWAEWC